MSRGKLVRDKIPQIIRSRGLEPVIHTADTEEYAVRLRDKLREEAAEFVASDDDPEELADILEVLYALARRAGIDQQGRWRRIRIDPGLLAPPAKHLE
jgi:predicted house-cleaning noncanonical NTP pyrophosphatase (MazG superfamily)